MFPRVLTLTIFVAQHSKTKNSTPTSHCWEQVSILDRFCLRAFPRFKNKYGFSIDSAATNCATMFRDSEEGDANLTNTAIKV